MNPQSTLLPLTYGIAEAAAIGGIILSAASLVLAVTTSGVLKICGRLWVRPTLSWVAVCVWSTFTFSVALDYRNQYAALAETLTQQQPVPSEQVATAALILQLQPTMWAVKMILLGLISAAMWVGLSRARAAAGMLLAYTNLTAARDGAPVATRFSVERHLGFAGTAVESDASLAKRVAEVGPVA